MIAARLLAQGKSLTEVAASVNSSVSSAKRWKEAWAAGGEAALRRKPHRGAEPRLGHSDRRRLLAALRRGAQSWSYSTDEWNCPRVKELIARLFGVEYHVDYVGTLLHTLGWSVHQAEYRARERDEAAVAAWREHEWPQIKKEVAAAS